MCIPPKQSRIVSLVLNSVSSAFHTTIQLPRTHNDALCRDFEVAWFPLKLCVPIPIGSILSPFTSFKPLDIQERRFCHVISARIGSLKGNFNKIARLVRGRSILKECSIWNSFWMSRKNERRSLDNPATEIKWFNCIVGASSSSHSISHVCELLLKSSQSVGTKEGRRTLITLCLIFLIGGNILRIFIRQTGNDNRSVFICNTSSKQSVSHCISKAPSRHCCKLAGDCQNPKVSNSEHLDGKNIGGPFSWFFHFTSIDKNWFLSLACSLFSRRLRQNVSEIIEESIGIPRRNISSLNKREITSPISCSSLSSITNSTWTGIFVFPGRCEFR
mmetsp:Transcript_1618/g.2136  ORF Transcript_1618/g.2136 Transcript_1618/m.2136 type:complete len:331 (+) Transcript_1618:113-1105(+)